MKIEFDHIIKTGGNGLWSNKEKWVLVTHLELIYWADKDEDPDFGELCVYFNTASWNPSEDGLIYTDDEFKTTLRAELDKIGLPGKDVSYSEQGMQGTDYVSFDAGDLFVKKWIKKYGKEHI